MSEKRFSYVDLLEVEMIFDEENERGYYFNGENCTTDDVKALVGLLNEQQSTIRKLQDLCGESDSENAKLRQEIKELKAQLREKEEDEQLYANEIVKLNKEAKEVLDFKSLGGDY